MERITWCMNRQNEILIAESGATKTEWRFLSNRQLSHAVRTTGFNPNVMSIATIESEMMAVRQGELASLHPDQIVFYGAGIGGDSQRSVMRGILTACWPSADIFVEHDLTAAARSTLRKSGIVCILGTGSNSCLYHDHEVVDHRGGHGYLFGDEGSGMDLGRQLIVRLLREELPDSIRTFVESQEGLSLYELKLAILRDEHPNVRLSRLAKHLDELIHHETIRNMVVERFIAFLDTTVCRYPNFQTYPVDVMGSISFHFQDLFDEAAQQMDVLMGHIIKDPVDQLVNYHLRQLGV